MLLYFEDPLWRPLSAQSRPNTADTAKAHSGRAGGLHTPAHNLARAAGLWPSRVGVHRFPDAEIKLTLPPKLPARVVVYCTLHQPNEKLIALLLTARTARRLGARHLTLVAPYLAYMRQDQAFAAGEAISQQVVGAFLASLFDALVTVDPHLHRTPCLQDVLPMPQVQVLSAAPLLGSWVARQVAEPLLLGPDEESWQWVSRAAGPLGLGFAVCHKQRSGDQSVQIRLPELDFVGRQVVLLDDIASTGQTLAQTAQLVRAAGAATVDVAVTHALMAKAALAQWRAAGVGRVWSSNSIVHPSNAVDLAPLLTQGLRQLQPPG